MKLIVKGENITPYGSGMFMNDLDPASMMRVYEEQKRQLIAEDIACDVEARSCGCGMEDSFAEDWPFRFGESIASRVVSAIDGSDWIGQQRSETISECVEKELKAIGIDPNTMKKGEQDEG